MPKNLKQERQMIRGAEEELRPESRSVDKVREFFLDAIPFNEQGELQKAPTRELFALYADAINSPPDFESFTKLAKKAGVKLSAGAPDTVNLFKKFLTTKLPRELIKNLMRSTGVDQEGNIAIEDLERLHAAREKAGAKMILGYHVANVDYEDAIPTSRVESVTLSPGGEEIIIPAGNAHYSINPKGLYKQVFERSGKKFLYFIEGSSLDFSSSNKDYVKAHRKHGWVSTARPLPIIFKVEIDGELEKELGLERA